MAARDIARGQQKIGSRGVKGLGSAGERVQAYKTQRLTVQVKSYLGDSKGNTPQLTLGAWRHSRGLCLLCLAA